MKLLKLNNGSTLISQWSNNFSDLVIKPNSKIALQGISLEVSNNDIVINNENNTFQFQVTQNTNTDGTLSAPKNVTITNGVYKSIQQLITEVENKLNFFTVDATLGNNTWGLQWKIDFENILI